ncbi:hypothetical protein AB0365_09195, partial [Brevibacterium casei]
WAVSELPSSEGLDPYPATDAPNPTTLSAAKSPFAELSESVNADVVFGVELCDADAEVVGTLFEDTRDNRRLIGEGVQDVAGFVETMRAIGFAGPWGVEILSAEHRQRPLREGLELARTTTLSAFR